MQSIDSKSKTLTCKALRCVGVFDWYSAITSVTEYRPETKTMFMYSATEANPLVSVLDEVKDGTQDVMLELKVHSNCTGMLGYRR